jgi:hypothetical protein
MLRPHHRARRERPRVAQGVLIRVSVGSWAVVAAVVIARMLTGHTKVRGTEEDIDASVGRCPILRPVHTFRRVPFPRVSGRSNSHLPDRRGLMTVQK